MTAPLPAGVPTIRTVAMPGDLNFDGDVFGGWLLSQMDLAGGMAARQRAKGRVATIGIEAMQFHSPVHMGDEVSCYCTLVRVGRTSLAYRVEVWVQRRESGHQEMVTHGTFTFVAIGADGRSRALPPG